LDQALVARLKKRRQESAAVEAEPWGAAAKPQRVEEPQGPEKSLVAEEAERPRSQTETVGSGREACRCSPAALGAAREERWSATGWAVGARRSP
jgi:hypothetical protein